MGFSKEEITVDSLLSIVENAVTFKFRRGMKIKPEWEILGKNVVPQVMRMKVYGGWLVRIMDAIENIESVAMSESTVFVPDQEHRWEIDIDKPAEI